MPTNEEIERLIERLAAIRLMNAAQRAVLDAVIAATEAALGRSQ